MNVHETCRRESKISIISDLLTLAKKSPNIKPVVFTRKICLPSSAINGHFIHLHIH